MKQLSYSKRKGTSNDLATVKVSSPPFVVFCCIRVVLLLLPLAPLHAQTQASMNAEARADFQRADADLNKTYQSVLAKLPDR